MKSKFNILTFLGIGTVARPTMPLLWALVAIISSCFSRENGLKYFGFFFGIFLLLVAYNGVLILIGNKRKKKISNKSE